MCRSLGCSMGTGKRSSHSGEYTANASICPVYRSPVGCADRRWAFGTKVPVGFVQDEVVAVVSATRTRHRFVRGHACSQDFRF
jgi:hypothetical protein